MTQSYAQSRIKNALKEHAGSQARARQAIMRAALEDPKLMVELVAPHLSGIVSLAMAHVEGGEQPAAPLREGGKESVFGMELLKGVADDNAVIFGQEHGQISGKAAASQDHIDAITMLAAKSKTSK